MSKNPGLILTGSDRKNAIEFEDDELGGKYICTDKII